MAPIRGFEILFSATKKDLNSKEDCVVAAIHCILINSNLLCLGVGEIFSDNDADATTELLPEDWNKSNDSYSLRYCSKDLKNYYLLKIVKAGSNLHVNFGKNNVEPAGMTIHSNDYVCDDYSKFSVAFKNLEELKLNIKKEILKGSLETNKKSTPSPDKETPQKETSPKNEPTKNSPTAAVPRYQPVPIGAPSSRNSGGAPYSFPQVGANDLDPLGRSRGGMLFDPSGLGVPTPFGGGRLGSGPFGGGPMGLPPGAVPPGARFDPFSPINPGRFNPDPDHYRPSDYDDMFM